MRTASVALLALLAAIALDGCSIFDKAPGTSVVQFYNNSGRTLLVEGNELRQGEQGTFRYPTDRSRPLIVFWGGCVHTYISTGPKPGEFRGTDWMLRGAYRTQLQPDRKLYLVPANMSVPGDPANMPQPEGFPLSPQEGSSCLP